MLLVHDFVPVCYNNACTSRFHPVRTAILQRQGDVVEFLDDQLVNGWTPLGRRLDDLDSKDQKGQWASLITHAKANSADIVRKCQGRRKFASSVIAVIIKSGPPNTMPI